MFISASILDAEFMRLAFAAGAIVGVLAPAVGFFLVQRRMSLIGDGIGHVAFAGVALGYLIDVNPVITALIFSVAGAVGIEQLRALRRTAGDQALALFFYSGIALGVVMLSAAKALNANLFTFLFGSILTVTKGDVLLVATLGIAALATVFVLYRGLVAVSIDEEAARVSGIPVTALNVVLAGLAGVTIAVSMRIVGILLIAALMVLPVITASRIASSLQGTLALSMGLGLLSVIAGLVASYYLDLAPGGDRPAQRRDVRGDDGRREPDPAPGLVLAGPDRPPRLPGDSQDHGGDPEPDQRIEDLGAESDRDGAGDHRQADVGVGAGVVAVGDQRRALELAPSPRADMGGGEIAEVADQSRRSQRDQVIDVLTVGSTVRSPRIRRPRR